MKRVAFALLGLLSACPPKKHPCESIVIAPIPAGTGSQTMCVLPSECRNDTMADLISQAACSDKSKGSCPAGNDGCQTSCVGTVQSSALKATCSWDRNAPCTTPSGEVGGKCSCDWIIPQGQTLTCGCTCAPPLLRDK